MTYATKNVQRATERKTSRETHTEEETEGDRDRQRNLHSFKRCVKKGHTHRSSTNSTAKPQYKPRAVMQRQNYFYTSET